MEKTWAIINGVSALVMAGATAMLGFTVPSIWTLSSDMGGVKATVAAIDKKLDGIESKLDALVKRADMIDMRLSAKESDPATIVAQSGLRPASEFTGLRVGEKVYALPKTDKAAAELDGYGARREAITPSAYGYVIGTVDAAGRFVGISQTGSTGGGGPATGR